MKLRVDRYSIKIIPESEIDEAYIEEVLGMRGIGSKANTVRVAPMGLDHALAYIEVKRKELDGK